MLHIGSMNVKNLYLLRIDRSYSKFIESVRVNYCSAVYSFHLDALCLLTFLDGTTKLWSNIFKDVHGGRRGWLQGGRQGACGERYVWFSKHHNKFWMSVPWPWGS